MSYRFMRVIVFFDLPTATAEDRRRYRLFRKGLIEHGFMMMQESVYCRMVPNAGVQQSVVATVRRIKPPAGIVQILTVTEKQFAKMECIVGEINNDIINSDARLIIL